MKKNIEVTISPAGEISIEAVGFKGADCEQATRFLEEALGTIQRKMKKPEYHQQTINSQKQRIGG